MLVLQICNYVLWFPMQILVISAILRAGIRRYALFLAYASVTLVVAMVQVPASFARFSHPNLAEWYNVLHAVAQGISYSLVLAVVLNLIYQATREVQIRRVIRVAATAGALLVAAISFLVHYKHSAAIILWMTPWTRDLNFCAAILDLVLWSLLLAAKRKEQGLLMLTGGMGIMFAGETIGDALRTIAIHYRSPLLFKGASPFILAADLTFLYIWWQVFRKQAAADSLRSRAGAAALNG